MQSGVFSIGEFWKIMLLFSCRQRHAKKSFDYVSKKEK